MIGGNRSKVRYVANRANQESTAAAEITSEANLTGDNVHDNELPKMTALSTRLCEASDAL